MTIDANTVISTVVLGLSAWTLKTVHEMAKTQAASQEHDATQDYKLSENRSRITEAERKVGALEVDVSALKAKRS